MKALRSFFPAAALALLMLLLSLTCCAALAEDAADPEVAAKVTQVVQECIASGASTDYEKALWLHDWLINNAELDYTYTESGPDGVLLKGTGTHYSYTSALSLLLTEAGLPNQIVSSEESGHGWNIVQLEGVWCHIDSVCNDPTFFGVQSHDYFGANDELMANSHTWDRDAYPACTSLAFYYNVRENVYSCVGTQEEFNALMEQELFKGNEAITVCTASDSFDLTEAFTTWTETDSWRFHTGKHTLIGGRSMLTISFTYVEPLTGVVRYNGDMDALGADLSAVFARRCNAVVMYDTTDQPFFTLAAYCRLLQGMMPYFAEYGCTAAGYCYQQGDRGVYVDLLFPDFANLPEPVELMGPATYSFFEYDSSDKLVTHRTYAGKRLLHVYGRLTCPNTMAFLSQLSAAAPVLRNADVEVVVSLFNLADGDLLRADRMFDSFRCTSAAYTNSIINGLYQLGLDYEHGFTFPAVFLLETNGDLIYGSTDFVDEPLRVIAAAIGSNEVVSTRLVLPATVTVVEAEAFAGCTDIYDVRFEGSVQSIGERAFAGCTSLRRITIPASVTTIGADAFAGCDKLTIFCTKDSAAYQYAVSNGISWKLTD